MAKQSIKNPLLLRLQDLLMANRTPQLAFEALTNRLATRPLSHEIATLISYRRALSSKEGKALCRNNKIWADTSDVFYGDVVRGMTWFNPKN